MTPDRSRVAGALVMAASVVALLVSALGGCQARAQARCQSAVNEALIRATNARAAAVEQDRQADREESTATTTLIIEVFASKSRDESLAAYERYRQKLRHVDEVRAHTESERASNPLPAPPSEVCG